jgi:asparagine synthase (glutamine-hydrolysing)
MCGIVGYYNMARQNFSVDHSLLDAMQKKIFHRGPDCGRVWGSDEFQLGLGFRRLSIIDLSQAAMQPMLDKDQSVIICFNGEIYNHLSVRQELISLGYRYFSNSDTETILYAYKEWGISGLEKLEGMFAIVIYDFQKRELYLVRDRIGVKPIYFTVQGGILAFASEIKAFWELPWVEKKISSLGLYHYLTFMVTPAPYTIYENIYKLPAGYYLKCDSKKNISFTEWYSPIKNISEQDKKLYKSEDFCVENIRTLLFESTKKRMIADVPVGAFLSGGIDSSLNVALMAQCISRVKTFTVSFTDGPESNELKWARMIANKYGTEHHEIEISERDAFDFYNSMVYQLDEPLADCVCIPFYFVSRLARDRGVTVVQVGEGADELFFGYDLYIRYKKLYERVWVPTQKLFPKYVKEFTRYGISPLLNTGFLKEILFNWAKGRDLFWGGALAFGELQKKKILNKNYWGALSITQDSIVNSIYKDVKQEFDSFSIIDYHARVLENKHPSADFGTQLFYLELKQRLPELLLMRADKMSMAASVEAREPFLDHKLIEFMLNIPIELRVKDNIKKYLLKKACQGIIPDEIINRKKMGFAAPIVNWFFSGRYFPKYFNEQQTNQAYSNYFTPSIKGMACVCKDNNARNAVQKWVLQTFWALK